MNFRSINFVNLNPSCLHRIGAGCLLFIACLWCCHRILANHMREREEEDDDESELSVKEAVELVIGR